MHINILKASKRLIKLLSAYSNNNSLHKLENNFCMRAGDQKLRYNLEWPNQPVALSDTDGVNNQSVALSDTGGVNNIFVAF